MKESIERLLSEFTATRDAIVIPESPIPRTDPGYQEGLAVGKKLAFNFFIRELKIILNSSNNSEINKHVVSKVPQDYIKKLRDNLILFLNFVNSDKEQPVSIEDAKLLKLLGFRDETLFYYIDSDSVKYVPRGLKCGKNNKTEDHNSFDEFIYSAPTVEHALIWINKLLNS